MKKIAIGIMTMACAFFASCEDWLAVKPFDSLVQEDVFLSERNANSALNGIYLRLTTNSLYAKEMSCGMMEVLAQHYIIPSQPSPEHPYYRLNSFSYDYKSASEKLADAFRSAYKGISECNELLAQIEAGKAAYPEKKYAIYCGEAIALRTFLHFDMLRLFGPKGGELDRASIPYYDQSTYKPQPILTANELADILLKDIDTAIEFLSADDILTDGIYDDLSIIDFFKSFRNLRMNYYAANALKARICLYKGTPESIGEAYEIASALIGGKDPRDPSKPTNFTQCFSFTKSANYQVYPEELLFAIHNINRNHVNKELFSSELDNTEIIGGGHAFLGYLYGIKYSESTKTAAKAPGGMDPGPRGKMWVYDPLRKLCLYNRYTVTLAHKSYPYKNEFQSMIRLGELYLIAAETAPTAELKRSWLEALRLGKGYNSGNLAGLADEKLDNIISIEFEKETYGEGQFFFYAKRKNLNLRSQSNSTVAMERGKFVPPLPDIETFYRNDLGSDQKQ